MHPIFRLQQILIIFYLLVLRALDYLTEFRKALKSPAEKEEFF